MARVKSISEWSAPWDDDAAFNFEIDDSLMRDSVAFDLIYGDYAEDGDLETIDYDFERFEHLLFRKNDDDSLWMMSMGDPFYDLHLLMKGGVGDYLSGSNYEYADGQIGDLVIAKWDLENLASDMYEAGDWVDTEDAFEDALLSSAAKQFPRVYFVKITESHFVDELIDEIRKDQLRLTPRRGTGYSGWSHSREQHRQSKYANLNRIFQSHQPYHRQAIKALSDWGQFLKRQEAGKK
jgi:hypothetical protein